MYFDAHTLLLLKSSNVSSHYTVKAREKKQLKDIRLQRYFTEQ